MKRKLDLVEEKGAERAREEARRILGRTGTMPVGFDVARILCPYNANDLRRAWRSGFDAECLRILFALAPVSVSGTARAPDAKRVLSRLRSEIVLR